MEQWPKDFRRSRWEELDMTKLGTLLAAALVVFTAAPALAANVACPAGWRDARGAWHPIGGGGGIAPEPRGWRDARGVWHNAPPKQANKHKHGKHKKH
jgi:hypothetical protein